MKCMVCGAELQKISSREEQRGKDRYVVYEKGCNNTKCARFKVSIEKKENKITEE